MSEKRNHTKWGLLVGALVVAGVAYWLWPRQAAAPQGFGFGTPSVTAIHAIKKVVALTEEMPGRTSPCQVAQIRPQVTGIIKERLFKEGSDVTAQQQLYQIDPALYRAACDIAEANVTRAQADLTALQAKFDRFEELVKIEAVSKQEYADIVAELAQGNAGLAQANAAFETARLNLEYTEVLAPISGRIGKSNVTKGALVTANQTDAMATITQLDSVYVDLVQPSDRIARLRAIARSDDPVSVTLLIGEEGAAYAHLGTLQFADVTVNASTDSVLLRALFPNPDLTLLPGMFVRARISLGSIDAILLPQRAVILMPDGSASVWVIDKDNKVSRRTVTTLKAIDDQWIVTDGISEKDTVVLEGYQRLTPSATVAPSFAQTPQKLSESNESGERH